MQNRLIASLIIIAAFLAACSETPPPPPKDVNVNITVEEQAPPKKVIDTKDERGTIIGDEQRYTRP